jgi:hypothetical protein
MKQSRRLLIISDNKPGHMAGSFGILKSFENIVQVESEVLQVSIRIKFLIRPLRILMNRPVWLNRIPNWIQHGIFRFAYKIKGLNSFSDLQGFDWVISTGGDTSFLNIWLAHRFGINNLYGSSLRGMNPALFTLVISTQPDTAEANVIKVDLTPSPIDTKLIAVQGQKFLASQALEGETVWAVLIGGDGSGYQLDSQSVEMLAKGLLKQAERHNAKLLITTSRRTKVAHEKLLQSIFSDQPNVAYATYYNQHPEKVVAKFLGAADLVFCTAESGSMLNEAMSAGKPVYALVSREVKPEPFYQRFLNQHIDDRRIKALPIHLLHEADITQDLSDSFQILQHDPVLDLAEKIRPWVLPDPE